MKIITKQNLTTDDVLIQYAHHQRVPSRSELIAIVNRDWTKYFENSNNLDLKTFLKDNIVEEVE
jgi:hypothetical protein